MQPEPVASTSAHIPSTPHQPCPPRAHSPPRWIVSLGDEGHTGRAFPTDPVPSADRPVGRAVLGHTVVRDGLGLVSDMDEDWQGGYGPTTRRRGKMRFVTATGLTTLSGALGSGEADTRTGAVQAAQEVTQDKGALVSNFYAGLVGLNTTHPAELPTPERGPPRPPQPPPDVDLTLDGDSDSDGANVELPSDDDLVILDSDGLPERAPTAPPRSKRRRLPPLPLPSALLPSADHTPHTPPIQYALRENSFGYSLLTRQGWRPGQPLGPPPAPAPAISPTALAAVPCSTAGPSAVALTFDAGYAQRLVVPLKAVEKHDRRGLGPNTEEDRRRRKAEDEARKLEKERKRREALTKGVGTVAREQKRESQWRKDMLAYMNH